MSEIRADTITGSDGTSPVTLTGQTAAKAWVNFNGTGTVAIRGSGNVSSITDGGTGSYTINFSNAMPDGNYATAGSNRSPGTQSGAAVQFDGYNATNLVFYTRPTPSGSEYDFTVVTAAVFR